MTAADARRGHAVETRLVGTGLASSDQRGTTCCYAKQTKFWVHDTRNGEAWEIYTVLEDSPSFAGVDTAEAGCCGSTVDLTPAPSSTACC